MLTHRVFVVAVVIQGQLGQGLSTRKIWSSSLLGLTPHGLYGGVGEPRRVGGHYPEGRH